MKKTLLVIIVLAVAIGAYLFKNRFTQNGNQPIPDRNKTTGSEVVVTYTDNGYSPKEVTVKVGIMVRFVNNSSDLMWTASDPHPIHTNLLGFDALKGYAKGSSYSYTFQQKGIWRYHNHLIPGNTGSVIVE